VTRTRRRCNVTRRDATARCVLLRARAPVSVCACLRACVRACVYVCVGACARARLQRSSFALHDFTFNHREFPTIASTGSSGARCSARRLFSTLLSLLPCRRPCSSSPCALSFSLSLSLFLSLARSLALSLSFSFSQSLASLSLSLSLSPPIFFSPFSLVHASVVGADQCDVIRSRLRIVCPSLCLGATG